MRPLSLPLLITPLLLGLAACGTPQERCINRETREVRNLQSLLQDVEGNLARGFAYENYEVPMTRWEICGKDKITRSNGTIIEKTRMCLEDYTVTRTRKVAIDPASETRKAEGLRRKIRQLTPQMQSDVATCRATYPE